MKKLNSLLATILVALAAISTPAGQSVHPAPPDLTMIKSLALLESYADTQGTEGSFQVYGDTILNDWGNPMVTAKLPAPELGRVVGDAEKVLAMLNAQPLQFRASSDLAKFYFYGSINNPKGRQLYYTGGETKLVPTEYGDYGIDDNARFPKWGLAPVIPIAFRGVQSAKVVVSDGNGGVQSSQLEVSDGYIMWQTNLVDRVGDLVVTYVPDGQDQPETVAYDLHTGTTKRLSYVASARYSRAGRIDKLNRYDIDPASSPWQMSSGGWYFDQSDFVIILNVMHGRKEQWYIDLGKILNNKGEEAVGVVIRSADDTEFEQAKYLKMNQRVVFPEGVSHMVPIFPSDPYRYLYIQWWGDGKG